MKNIGYLQMVKTPDREDESIYQIIMGNTEIQAPNGFQAPNVRGLKTTEVKGRVLPTPKGQENFF